MLELLKQFKSTEVDRKIYVNVFLGIYVPPEVLSLFLSR